MWEHGESSTEDWSLQQLREVLPGDHPYGFLIHDRDSMFWKELDKKVRDMEVRVLRTPARARKANSETPRRKPSSRVG